MPNGGWHETLKEGVAGRYGIDPAVYQRMRRHAKKPARIHVGRRMRAGWRTGVELPSRARQGAGRIVRRCTSLQHVAGLRSAVRRQHVR